LRTFGRAFKPGFAAIPVSSPLFENYGYGSDDQGEAG
jgi:hypothetical protein